MIKIKSKNIKISMLIIMMLLVVTTATYAWLTWRSTTNTELTLSFGNLADLTYKSGKDINVTNLGPVLDYNQGESTTFIIKKRIATSLFTTVNLDITTISTELRVESFKWILLSSSDNDNYTKLSEGTFQNQATGNLTILDSATLAAGSTYYKFIIYIDGNMENNPNMQNKTFTGTLNVNVDEPKDIKVVYNSLFNQTGAYTIIPNCTNATVTPNYALNGITVSNITGLVNCNPTLTQVTIDSTAPFATLSPSTPAYLSPYIESLSLGADTTGTTEGVYYIDQPATAQTVAQREYRYMGKNPNNYIKFNNELWRIIGVFPTEVEGTTGTVNLTKIIKLDSIGGYAWDSNSVNNWVSTEATPVKATLNSLLNDTYYNHTTTNLYYFDSSYYQTCDFTKRGIQTNYQNMIAKAKWYLGGYSSETATSPAFYGYERSNTVYSSTYSTATYAKIGLMYPSDYGYSVLANTCGRTTNLGSYGSTACGGNAWLKHDANEWTITHRSSRSSHVFFLDNYAGLSYDYAGRGCATRPVLYLETDVHLLGGSGTQTDPYEIGM